MSAQPVNPNLPPDHVTVFIDGVELAAPKGSMIIHAADKAGIPIPRFCYHDKLAVAANCRMCLVDTEVGGRSAPKPSPACATPVMDGLKVFTRNEKALKAQRNEDACEARDHDIGHHRHRNHCAQYSGAQHQRHANADQHGDGCAVHQRYADFSPDCPPMIGAG